MTRTQDSAVLAARILLSLLFVTAGYGKLMTPASSASYMQSLGIPTVLLYFTILLELGGGLAILAGAFTRPAAILLAAFSIMAGLIAHLEPGNSTQMISFWKNLGLAGGFLLLAVQGAGTYSIDANIGRRIQR